MTRLLSFVIIIVCLAVNPVFAAASGHIQKKSPYSVSETLDRLEQVLKEKNITVMARLDHAGNAKKVDMELRPTQLLIFGNPKLGTQLMREEQTAGIDLPLKALAWKDLSGQVWLAYERPEALAERRGIAADNAVIRTIAKALEGLTNAAIKR